MGTLLQDLRYGARMLRKSPGFTLIAVLTLALGIGANTAIFSFVDAWMIKPLPYPQSDRLMVLLAHDKKKGWTSDEVTSTADFFDYRQQNKSFAGLVAWYATEYNLTGDGTPVQVDGGKVSPGFFDLLGVHPILGRTFLPEEEQPGKNHVAIINTGLWESRYARDANILTRTITINGESYNVVGVVAGKFQFPLMGLANVWTPLAPTDKERADRNISYFSAFGRLNPGVTEAQANAEATAFFARLEKLYPKTNANMTALLSSMITEIGNNEGTQQVLLLMWIVGLILLIACANVASLMLARAARRTREIAVRGALGATRGRLIRQLVTESTLLFLLGGTAGIFFGKWGMNWIDSSIPPRIRRYLVNYGEIRLDFVTLAFTLAIALACGLIFGLAPAFQSSRLDVNRALKEASGQSSGSKHGMRLRRVFVAGEIALAVLVLISTTLLVKSFVLSAASSPGFQPENLTVAQLVLPKTKYSNDAQIRNFTDQVLARIRALPQVAAAGLTEVVPFSQNGETTVIEALDRPAPEPGEELGARYSSVSPDYFDAMQIHLIRGRTFTAADGPDAPPVMVIGQTLASQLWPKEDPVGQKMKFGEKHTVATIVGVVNDVKMYSFGWRPSREMYVPMSQSPPQSLGVVVRSRGDSASLASAIRDSIWAVDSDEPISQIQTMAGLMYERNAGDEIVTKLMAFFGVLALFLGAIGIYGVMANSVAQRTHEIGIRMALGANTSNVMRLVVGQGLKLTLIGVVLGLLGAFGTTRFLAFMLYNVNSYDPLTFAGATLLFFLVAMLACYIPARRAMRVDPMVALRYE
jgi:putative ABC transport system permease protein